MRRKRLSTSITTMATTVFAVIFEKRAHRPTQRLMKAILHSSTISDIYSELHETTKTDSFVCFAHRAMQDDQPFEVKYEQTT